MKIGTNEDLVMTLEFEEYYQKHKNKIIDEIKALRVDRSYAQTQCPFNVIMRYNELIEYMENKLHGR